MNRIIKYLPILAFLAMAFLPHDLGFWPRAAAVVAAFSGFYICARVIPDRQAREAQARGEA